MGVVSDNVTRLIFGDNDVRRTNEIFCVRRSNDSFTDCLY